MKKTILLSSIIVLATSVASQAEVTLDTTSSLGAFDATSGSISSFDISSDANLLIAVVSYRFLDGSVTGVTYNSGGQSFTKLGSVSGTAGAAGIDFWYLANPTDTSGTDVTVSLSDDADTRFGVYSLKNADTNTANWTTAFFNNSGNSQDTDPGATWSTDLNGVDSGSFIIDGFAAQNLDSLAASGAGRTATEYLHDGSGSNTSAIGSSYISNASGDYTVGYDVTAADFGGARTGNLGAIAITTIPEPSTFALLAGAFGLVLVFARRRRG